jgi:hypothetical protein
MSSVAVRLSSQSIFRYCPHTSVSGDTWQYVKSGTTTSAGASNGTTLIDINGDSGSADAYNGKYWVKIKSGALKGAWKRVVDDDGAGTLTFENNGFEAQVASGVAYEIHLSPDPVVVVDSSSGETDMVDAGRSEADDYWNGYWVVPITGNRRGKIAQISDFVSSTGTFTLATGLGGALAAGDVVLIRKFVEISEPNLGLTEEYEERRQQRTDFAEGDGVVTMRGGTCAFDTDFYPSGSLAAASSKANASVLSGLLPACGYAETVQTSTSVTTGSSTTAVKVTAAWENFSIGGPVVWNGNLRWVTALADGTPDTVTVTPAFPNTPASGDVLYAGRKYAKTTSGDTYGCVLEYEVDGIRTTMTGCKGNVVLNDGARIGLSWSFMVDHWIREIEELPANPASAYTTAAPVLSQDRHVYVDGSAADIGGFTCSLNASHVPKNVQGASGINGRAGFHFNGQAAGCTFRELLSSSGDSLPQQLKFTVRTAFALQVNWGTHGGAAGVRIPVARIRQHPHPANDNGLQAVPSVCQAQDAGSTTDGASTVVKVPDFTIGIM